MTRKERHDKLKTLCERMPLDFAFHDQQAFIPWQGEVSALLGYNPKLQSDFQGAVNAIESQNPFDMDNLDTIGSLHRPNTVIRRILAQAISELAIPEEPPKRTAPIEFVPTDEHRILWFVTHCTWGSRLRLLGLVAPLVIAVFFAGFRLGAIERARNLYMQWENSLSAQPSPSPSAAQPHK